jgi:hypothetical protein
MTPVERPKAYERKCCTDSAATLSPATPMIRRRMACTACMCDTGLALCFVLRDACAQCMQLEIIIHVVHHQCLRSQDAMMGTEEHTVCSCDRKTLLQGFNSIQSRTASEHPEVVL